MRHLGVDVSDMRPSSALNDLLNSGAPYTIFLSKLVLRVFIRLVLLANFLHLFFGKLRKMMMTTFAQYPRVTSFIRHVFQVIRLRAKKQMRRVYTPPIVAMMANLYSFWGRIPISEKPHYTVCLNRLAKKPEVTSTIFFSATSPGPAFVRPSYFNLIPKTLHLSLRQHYKGVDTKWQGI